MDDNELNLKFGQQGSADFPDHAIYATITPKGDKKAAYKPWLALAKATDKLCARDKHRMVCVRGVDYALWSQWCRSNGMTTPKGLTGHEKLTRAPFKHSPGDLWFHIKGDSEQACQQILAAIIPGQDDRSNEEGVFFAAYAQSGDIGAIIGIGQTGGTGLTPAPQPGIYYSWPQVLVSGSVILQGTRYAITSGSGWIDHQLLMTSLQNANGAVHPVPFVEDAQPYNRWTWQFYNLDNGEAFSGPAFVGEPKSGLPDVAIPMVRGYARVENKLFGSPLSGVATPWCQDGTFNTPDCSLGAQSPADYTAPSSKADGLGHMETVGLQPVAEYRKFARDFLKNGTLPSGR